MMSTQDATIFIGDLARAFDGLQPRNPATEQAIAVMLGMTLEPPVVPRSRRRTPRPAPDLFSAAPLGSDEWQDSDLNAPEPTLPSVERRFVPSVLEGPTSVSVALDAMPSPLPKGSDTAELLPEPLFLPRWTRSILSIALSTHSNDGPPDIRRLVEGLSRGEPMRAVPRQRWRTLRRGVQVLLDRGSGMMPYIADRTQLTRAIRDVAGIDRVHVLNFAGTPLRGAGPGPQTRWKGYRPPGPGTAVALISNLGIGLAPDLGEAGDVAEWLAFAAAVRAAGATPIAFVPYKRDRCPPPLRRALTIVPWDRGTTAGQVRHLVKRPGADDRGHRLADDYRVGPLPDQMSEQNAADELGPAKMLISRVASSQPNAVYLARCVSLAVRVEPALLRSARLEFLPSSDAGLEADLWFSPLVHSRSTLYTVLREDIIAVLRQQLLEAEKFNTPSLEEIWALLEKMHRGAPPAIQLEERVAYRALAGEMADTHAAAAEIEQLLQSVVAAMIKNKRRAPDLAAWAARALPRLPRLAQRTETAKGLAIGASLHLDGRPILDAELPSGESQRWLARIVPRRVERVEVGVRLLVEAVEFSDPSKPDVHILKAPRTSPVLLAVSGDEGQPVTVRWLPGTTRLVAVPAGPVTIRTLLGELYTLRPMDDRAGAADERGSPARGIDQAVPDPWLDVRRFVDRQSELRELADYVETLSPDLGGQSAPLVIHGPGGIGKTSLLQVFVQRSVGRDGQTQFPYAYLDFKRRELDVAKAVTLLAELVRQLGGQYPHARAACEGMRAEWLRRLSTAARSFDRDRDRVRAWQEFERIYATLGVNDRPFVLILDSFEEVQVRGTQDVEHAGELLSALQARIPRLRTIIASRAPIKGFATRVLELSEFDLLTTQAYLAAHGVSDPELARQVAERIGGNPYTLQLAVHLIEKEGLDSPHIAELLRRSEGQDETVIAGLLQRIINRIDDPDVHRLVLPGMIVRRVTPEIIADVLAGPSGVEVRDAARTQDLFDKLGREVSLVFDMHDGSLRLRPDVRHNLIRLLHTQQPEAAAEIHRRAVAFYERREGLQARAEEIYHRLMLGQESSVVASRWMDGVEPYLQSAVDDLPLPSRVFLASRLGIELPAEVLEEYQRPAVVDAGTAEAELAIEQGALEHVLRAQLSSTDHDVVEKASKVGLYQLTDTDLRQLLNALGWSGTVGVSPLGLLVYDFATRVVARLEKFGPLGSDVHESMARLLAQTEYELGLTNQHQRVKAFEDYCKEFKGDPQAASKWLARMQDYRGDILKRLAVYYPKEFSAGPFLKEQSTFPRIKW